MAEETTDNFEDMPTMEMESPPSNGTSNGHSAPNDRAGLQQMFVGSEDSNYFDLPKELMQAPGDFAQLMARSRVDKNVAAALVDIMTEDDQYLQGSITPTRVVWLTLGMSIGIEGRGREDAIRASVGNQSWKASLQSFGDRVFGNRTQTNGTAQRDGPT